jgi:hypothetical protein
MLMAFLQIEQLPAFFERTTVFEAQVAHRMAEVGGFGVREGKDHVSI